MFHTYNPNPPDEPAHSGPPADTFHGRFRDILFDADEDGRRLRGIARYIADAHRDSADFSSACARAGAITVRFGAVEDVGAHWDAERREVILDRYGPEGPRPTSMLKELAVFEILNAASETERERLDISARTGEMRELAAAEGISSAKYYGREIERLEFRNIGRHRRIMAEISGRDSGPHVFSGYSRDFEEHYRAQCRVGPNGERPHVESYEDRYHYLRRFPLPHPDPERAQLWTGRDDRVRLVGDADFAYVDAESEGTRSISVAEAARIRGPSGWQQDLPSRGHRDNHRHRHSHRAPRGNTNGNSR